ncbi:MAG TPA: hypothetical protein VFT03_00250, partial [Rubrobacteraceae bacterium]|nr:hypothetical protein [Rubrobacteraceae bacterium]
VGKSAEAVVVLYAEMEEHGVGRGGASLHPHVRAAVRRVERLKEMDRLAPETEGPLEAVEAPQRSEEQESPKSTPKTEDSHETPEHQSAEEQPAEEQPAEEQPQRRRSWWREYFGFD